MTSFVLSKTSSITKWKIHGLRVSGRILTVFFFLKVPVVKQVLETLHETKASVKGFFLEPY